MASEEDVRREAEAVSRLRRQVSDERSEALRVEQEATNDYYMTKLREERARLEAQQAQQRKRASARNSTVMQQAEAQAQAAERQAQVAQTNASEGE